MRPHFEHVERETGVARVTPELAGRNAAVVKRGADALGWSGDYLERNARGCVGSGVCAFGCPDGRQAARRPGVDRCRRGGGRTHGRRRASAADRDPQGAGAGGARPARGRQRHRGASRPHRGGLRSRPHAAPAAPQPAGSAFGRAGPQPGDPPLHRGAGGVRRGHRDGRRGAAVLLRRRVRRGGDHVRGCRRAAGLPGGEPALLARAPTRADAALRAAVAVRPDDLRPLPGRGHRASRPPSHPLPPRRRRPGPGAPRDREAHRALLGRRRAHRAPAGGWRPAAARRGSRAAGDGTGDSRPATSR